MPNNRPTIAPITRGDAFVRTGRRHARQLAETIPLLSERPVVAMPTSPTNTAIHRVLLGCVSAELICLARPPVMPTSSGSTSETNSATNPSTPTTKSSNGTKNRNSRNARALPTIVPADSRSRW